MIWDISPLIHEKTAVWPGDQAFLAHVAMDFSQGDHLKLSSIQTTVHIGAHTDAPNHYDKHGVGIDEQRLDYYLGPAQVIRVLNAKGRRLNVADLAGHTICAPRILFATDTFPDPDHFNQDFASLSPELIEFLAQKNVCLVGIDTPSVDPVNSKTLESHTQIARSRMAILEGIVLTSVPEGVYHLTALPLKIARADASPVRAILVSTDHVYITPSF